ncbi:MAG: protease inhibitor I42 family protein [Acidobacteriota bacterium]
MKTNKVLRIRWVVLLCMALLTVGLLPCWAANGASTPGTIISIPITQPTASSSTATGYGTQQVNQLPNQSASRQTVPVTPPVQPVKGKKMNNVINIDDKYNGKTLTIKKGQSFKLTLPSNPSTGYSWSFSAAVNTKVLLQAGHAVSQPPPHIVGAGITEIWNYKAIGKGVTSITLGYKRPWEKNPPIKTFKLKVVVNN